MSEKPNFVISSPIIDPAVGVNSGGGAGVEAGVEFGLEADFVVRSSASSSCS